MTSAVVTTLAAIPPFAHAALAGGLELQLPIVCTIGKDCFIQYYVDVDPGNGARDYTCGRQTRDGHKGTDIRVRSTADTADVVASADGVVKGLRDGVADKLLKDSKVPDGVKGRECGNGVVIDHGGGWETQYCHMKRGSVQVKSGERVKAGDRLGKVGYSGLADFAHVHLSVRKDGIVVDPFRRGSADQASCGPGANPVWSNAAMEVLQYRQSEILDVGFADAKVELGALETGALRDFAPQPVSPALVAWGWAINLEKGDELAVTLSGPVGETRQHQITLKRRQAHHMLFTGKRLKSKRWPSGRYVASFSVRRDGTIIAERQRSFVMR